MNDIEFEIHMYEQGLTEFISSDPDLTCLKCNNLHCDYSMHKTKKGVKQCMLTKKKLKNKYRKLQNYVYHNIKTYGNSIISEYAYENLGIEKIKQDLAQNGFVDIYISRGTFGTLIVEAKYDKERDEVIEKINY
jgi:hypothetical protein